MKRKANQLGDLLAWNNKQIDVAWQPGDGFVKKLLVDEKGIHIHSARNQSLNKRLAFRDKPTAISRQVRGAQISIWIESIGCEVC